MTMIANVCLHHNHHQGSKRSHWVGAEHFAYARMHTCAPTFRVLLSSMRDLFLYVGAGACKLLSISGQGLTECHMQSIRFVVLRCLGLTYIAVQLYPTGSRAVIVDLPAEGVSPAVSVFEMIFTAPHSHPLSAIRRCCTRPLREACCLPQGADFLSPLRQAWTLGTSCMTAHLPVTHLSLYSRQACSHLSARSSRAATMLAPGMPASGRAHSSSFVKPRASSPLGNLAQQAWQRRAQPFIGGTR